jgi:hypothetical protein
MAGETGNDLDQEDRDEDVTRCLLVSIVIDEAVARSRRRSGTAFGSRPSLSGNAVPFLCVSERFDQKAPENSGLTGSVLPAMLGRTSSLTDGYEDT